MRLLIPTPMPMLMMPMPMPMPRPMLMPMLMPMSMLMLTLLMLLLLLTRRLAEAALAGRVQRTPSTAFPSRGAPGGFLATPDEPGQPGPMTTYRMKLVSLCVSVVLAGLVSWPGTNHADQDGVVIEDVRMGDPGDRWIDLMPLRRIERSTIDGVFGYAVAYDGADGGEQIFFFPRSVIDLAGEKPLATQVTIKAPGGRIWYPDKITARSLPRVYWGIIEIERSYRADARGALKAMEAFVLVFGAADAAPAIATLTARAFSTSTRGRGGILLLEVKGAASESAAVTVRTTSAAERAPASSSASAARVADESASAVPTTSRLVRSKVTAGATVKRVSASTGGSPRALAKAMEAAGYTRPPETAVHHIVAHTAKKAEPARKVLRRVGIDIDDAANGVFLPATKKSANPGGSAVHSTLHTNDYYEAVNEMLKHATTRAEVVERLGIIRARLLLGTMVR